MRQEIVKVFSEHGFEITIFINLKRVDFLDITLDLEKGTFKPYRKPEQPSSPGYQKYTSRN